MPTPTGPTDLHTEAARQHANLFTAPDLAAVGQTMDARSNTPQDGPTWHHLDERAFDTALQQVHDLITGAANLSQWAVSLGADGLEPAGHTIDLTDNDGCRGRVHFAFRTGTPETEQHALTAAFMTRAQQPPTDQADLRDRIADALTAEHYRRAEARIVASPEEHCAAMADAVLAVLPTTDRAAVLRSAAQRLYTGLFPAVYNDLGQKAAEGVNRAVSELRRMADETATTETHACPNCEGVDPDTCFNNPNRPPEQCPRSEGDGYGLQCQKPAGHNLCTFEEQPAAGARQDRAQP